MKHFLLLINFLAISGLILYDYQILSNGSQTVQVIQELTSMLDTRGRHRYEIQKHYLQWLEQSSNDDSLRKKILSNGLFTQPHALSNKKVLAGWPHIAALEDKLKTLQNTKGLFFDIPFEMQNRSDNLKSVDIWLTGTVDALDDIQIFDRHLSDYLSETLVVQIKQVMVVNSTVLIGLLALTTATVYVSQRQSLRLLQSSNEEISNRQNDLQTSKRLLTSLMADLKEERDAATGLSKQLVSANRDLLHKNDELEQFIYTVSHDLKSPLVTIGGFATLLSGELEDQLTEKQSHRLQRIIDNVDHMGALLADLLQLSRVAREEVVMTTLDIGGVISQQKNALEGMLDEASAEVVVETPLQFIVANERLLSQCVLNLLSNALKYRDAERPLQINISTVEAATYTALVVKDNGIGIDEKYQQRIFRIFERLGHGEGTGVGLAIVKSIMDKHDGEIIVKSEPGIGTEFSLRFPNRKITDKAA